MMAEASSGRGGVITVVLAGGLSSRMGGGDKALQCVGGVPILQRVLAALAPQCDTILLNANGDAARFAGYGCLVVPDTLPTRPGPLAGILAGLDHAASVRPAAGFILTVPGDAPFLPPDLLARLVGRQRDVGAAVVQARSGGRTHGVVGLWSTALRSDLRSALVDEGIRRVATFSARHAAVHETWPMDGFDPFLNINTPEDLAVAEQVVGGAP